VAVALFAGDFPSKPPGRFESAVARAIGKFYLRHDQTGMSAPVNIELDQNVLPRNFVAHLAQSSPGRARPERCELFRAQFDFAFFAVSAPTDLERQRRATACLSEADLSAGRFACQITLLDNKTSRPFQVIRRPFDQKFSFNFAIVSRSIDPSHELNILDAVGVVSRLSRRQRSNELSARVGKELRLFRLISAPLAIRLPSP